MVLTGVWPLSTNIMGSETTDFTLLVKNSRDEMQMLSPGGLLLPHRKLLPLYSLMREMMKEV